MDQLNESVRHDRWSMLYLLVFLIGTIGTAFFIINNWTGSIGWMNDAIGISSILCLFAFFKYRKRIDAEIAKRSTNIDATKE